MDAGRAWWERHRGEDDPSWEELGEEPRRVARERAEAEEVTEEIARLSAEIDGLRARRQALIRRLDELGGSPGFASIRELLAWRVGMTSWDAREEVRVARALGELPTMREAYERGEVSWSKLRHATRVAEPSDEAELTEMAREVSGPRLRRACQALHSEKEVARAEKAGEMPPERRWVRTSRVDARHSRLRAQLLHEEMALVRQAIEEAVREDYREEWARKDEKEADDGATYEPSRARGEGDGKRPDAGVAGDGRADEVEADGVGSADETEPPSHEDDAETDGETVPPPREDPRETFEARKADALLGLAVSWLDREAGATPIPGRTELMIHVRRDPGDESPGLEEGRLDDGTDLPADAVETLACDASVVEVFEDDDGEVVGTGPRTRTIPASTRRALHLRDEGRCRFPGCVRKLFLDGHHVVPWSEGGPSTLDNLALLCRKHHRMLHREEFSCAMEGGEPVFRDRGGRRIVEAPRRPRVVGGGRVRGSELYRPAPTGPVFGQPLVAWSEGPVLTRRAGAAPARISRAPPD